MGMSLADFCRCTPSEYEKVWAQWRKREEEKERQAWERTRTQCLCMLQPWSEKRLEARDVMQFPWDENKKGRSEERPESRDEIMSRYRAAKKAYGMK